MIVYDYLASASSFYLHWPFCPYRCRFCPFIAMMGHEQYMESYNQALVREIEHFSAQCSCWQELEIIFSGMELIKFANAQAMQEQIEQDLARSIEFIKQTTPKD